MADNPYESPNQFGADGQPGYAIDAQQILSKVKPPAIGLLVVGIINVCQSLFGLVMSTLAMMGMNAQQEAQQLQIEQMQEQGVDENTVQMIQGLMQVQGPIGLVLGGIAVIVGAVIILGALKMMKLQSYGFAFASSILAMIPCLSSCCIVGLPIGIWCLVVLSSADVKQAFQQNVNAV